MYELYNDLIEVNEVNEELISFYSEETKETKVIYFGQLKEDEPLFLSDFDACNQVLLKSNVCKEKTCYLYIYEKQLFLLKGMDRCSNKSPFMFDIHTHNNTRLVLLKRKGFAGLQIVDANENELICIDNFLTKQDIQLSIDCELDVKKSKQILHLLSKATCDQYHLIVTYNRAKRKLKIKKIFFEKVLENDHLLVTVSGHDKISITNKYNGKKTVFPYKEVKTNKAKKVFGKHDVKYFKKENLLGIYIIDKEKYYLYLKLNGLFMIKKRPGKATQFKVYLKSVSLAKNIYIYGRMVHHAYNSFGKYEELYTMDEKHHLATFKRPFRKIKFLKQFGYFKVPLKKMDTGEKVHYPLFIGSKDYILHKFPLGRRHLPSKNYSIKKVKDKVHVIRTNIYNQATYSIVPYTKMYGLFNRMKINFAHRISKWFYANKPYNVNLYFEKQASKADESGFRVFEEVKKQEGLHSKNYFILDKKAGAYSDMKKKYGKGIIKRFSFKHYLAIFNADYFISSDLSNHVINDRIYNNQLMDKIKEVPLIFLQHGIMFAKPVENPLGRIFYKDYSAYNIYKNVVNSRLEAKEFYKMGYTDNDLLFTGLATFDYAKMNPSSDKIVYMPTYRYWEEGMIYSGEIEKTTYFKSLIKIIKAFEKAGLRDRLMIVSHNKFADFIRESLSEYEDVLGENPSEALKVGRIFITDYSSAIYDAIYRGAYPIFYWEDKDYLALKYQATPPVNEQNAPGPIAWNPEEVVEIAKEAIRKQYETEKIFKEKYQQINAFNDNRNTERIIRFLKEDDIL